MKTELYKKHRPKNLKSIFGQDQVVKIIKGMIINKRIPHTILFSGPSGCGKTTIMRILKIKLNCSKLDFREINCSDFRGIDMVRQIRREVSLAPIDGDCRIWYIDECHRLTGEAQDAFLKLLEDTPQHAYFFLSTTNPEKLKKTIITRSTHFYLELIKDEPMKEILERIIKKEEININKKCIKTIVEVSGGSARTAIVILNQVMNIDNENEMREAIQKSDQKSQAIELARLLINPESKWSDVVKILRNLDDDAESLRYMILGYANSILLKGGKKLSGRAYVLIDTFRANFYDSKKAGLTAACWEVYNYK